jgi:hypothetical protein
MTLKQNSRKKTKTNKQVDLEQSKGKKAYRLREQQDLEAKEEIKAYKIPPCVGHAFEKEQT